ncbi:protein kinase [Starmerella bacillaris]|uniref:Protein-serine/threonine kinase n=1 Tax=Starmerella bacillaris TaxID=1247836 RepID=A0AAV5RFH0_STABA|nr:protein kinase [Starmerella bacillaris]
MLVLGKRIQARRLCQYSALKVQESLRVSQAILDDAIKPTQPIVLNDLLRWRHNLEPKEEALIRNAGKYLELIRTRLARQLDSIRDLPLLAVLNPYISSIYKNYFASYETLSRRKAPKTSHENLAFTEELEDMIGAHTNNVQNLATGIGQCSSILSPEETSDVLWENLRLRIGTRILAEHHIALTKSTASNFVGAVQLDVNPAEIVESIADLLTELASVKFGFSPNVRVDIGKDVTFAYLPHHVEYILMEIMKNSFWALCSRGENVAEDNPVVVTVIRSGQGVLIRVRDRGGGIPPEHEKRVFDFSFSSVTKSHKKYEDDTDRSLAGLGYGLPMSKVYAEFFGGQIQLQSYFGWGTDAYVTLPSPFTSINSNR